MAVGDLLGSETAVATSGNTTINISVSPTITVAVGDLIFVAAGQLTNLEMTPNAVSDNMGNTYSSAGTPGDAGSATIAGYYSIVQTAGSLTSVSVAGKTTNANDYAIVMCVYAGSFSAADKLVATASDNATPFACPSTGVLSQANELVIGYGAGSATTSFGALSASAPMTMNAQDAFGSAASIRTAVASKIVSATTATAPAFTGTASGTINGQWGTATFKIGAIHAVTGAETAASSEAETAILTAVGASTESIATSETEDGIKFNPTRIFGGYNFLNTDAVNWAGLTLRVRFEPSMLAANNGGNERVTFEFLAGTSGAIAEAYIGHAAASGDLYDFDGAQIQLTFFGGSTSWSVSGASSISSDYALGFGYDPTRALIISVAFTGTQINLAGF